VSPGAPGSGEVAEPDEVLDCLGQRCPLPVIALARRLPRLPVGAVVRVLADDPAAANDIPAWCRLRDQEYLGSPARHAYDVRRRD
jgi:tRNA 2-thiouridine synthesizing protein A